MYVLYDNVYIESLALHFVSLFLYYILVLTRITCKNWLKSYKIKKKLSQIFANFNSNPNAQVKNFNKIMCLIK